MQTATKNYLEGKRNSWLSKVAKITAGDDRAISQRMYQITADQFVGDPTSFRQCVACGDYAEGGWAIYEPGEGDGRGYHICAKCGAIQQMIGTRGDVPATVQP